MWLTPLLFRPMILSLFAYMVTNMVIPLHTPAHSASQSSFHVNALLPNNTHFIEQKSLMARGGWLAATLILATEVAQELCVVGISRNRTIYLKYVFISTPTSNNIANYFLVALNAGPRPCKRCGVRGPSQIRAQYIYITK